MPATPAIDRCVAARSPEQQSSSAAELRDHLIFIEREGLARCGRGPFWLGREPSIIDLAYYPFFERLPAIQQHRPVALPPVSIRLRYWLDAMRERDSVKAARNIAEGPVEPIRTTDSAKPPMLAGGKVEFLHA